MKTETSERRWCLVASQVRTDGIPQYIKQDLGEVPTTKLSATADWHCEYSHNCELFVKKYAHRRAQK